MNTNKAAKFNKVMRDAIGHRNLGRSQEAVALLLPHVHLVERSAPAAGLLATLYNDLLDDANSTRWFATAVRLAPRSERASLGLFHSLWDIGERDQAFDEMRRFLIVGESTEYPRLLRELKKELSLDDILPSKLPIEERFSVNAAENAGLDWRKSNHLTPLKSLELRHA